MVESLFVPCTGCARAGEATDNDIPLPNLAAKRSDVAVDADIRVVVAVDCDRTFVAVAVVGDPESVGEIVGDRAAEAADASKQLSNCEAFINLNPHHPHYFASCIARD